MLFDSCQFYKVLYTLESIFNEIESFGFFFIIEISLEIEQSLRFLLENNGLHPCLATGKREREREAML